MMIIKPKCEEKLDGNYVFGAKTFCQANSVLVKPIFKEFWHRFCFNSGDIEFDIIKDFMEICNPRTVDFCIKKRQKLITTFGVYVCMFLYAHISNFTWIQWQSSAP